jgi:signal transduction histidine kinase
VKKEQIKKILIPSSIFILICIIVFSILTIYQYHTYITTVNTTIENIVDEIRAQYPQVSEEKLIKIINGSINKKDASTLKKYGYTDNKVAYIKELEKSMKHSTIINLTVLIFIGIIGILILLLANKKQEKKIEEINHYLKTINNRNYQLKIEENTEDELSKLRNELYKTTVLLKESAENSEQEKINLSNSLADISHQLKTPLTSIRILLDNINENPQMDKQTKKEFLNEISKQIDWISSLTISLLKLAKFDSGSIVMNDEMVDVTKLMNEVISNLDILLDLKNIQIIKKYDNKATIKADYKWQIEALTNILKNAIEHSKENSKIIITTINTSVFTKIIIQDEGEGIDSKDIKHIFERFYKSEHSSKESTGIGLALAKTIIEKENGYIKVESKSGCGTTFEIKYVKC